MEKRKYKDQNNKNYIFRIIGLLILIFIFFLATKILENVNENNFSISYNDLSTIKQVIEYYESRYISERKSSDATFSTDVYLEFKVLPYNEDDSSNEQYYTNLITDCARVSFFNNFRLIDSQNDITVQVICKNGKIDKILINDIEDYFIYMDSQINLKNYIEIPITEMSVESEILQECINHNWTAKSVDFGTRESIFDGYDIYFDEGIRVKIISGKIFNIIFNKNYTQNIINGFYPGMDLDTVKNHLGKPAFQDSEKNIIGYKGNELYVFFNENEISVYRNTEEETDDFFELTDRFIAEEIDLLDYMNELTYIWPDYSDYDYGADHVFISYPLKGIEIKINYDDINGILVYNNIKAHLSKIGTYLKNTYFVARLQLDLVFNYEVRRINSEKEMIDNCLEFNESLSEADSKIIGKGMKYDIYPLRDNDGYIFSMRFISKNGDMPNRELVDGISNYCWFGDYFIYSKRMKGIYAYDTNTGVVTRLVTGNDEYRIYGIENGILKYDDEQVNIQY